MTGRLREAREAQGLTQFQLAVRVETIPGVIARIERGDGNPRLDVALRIARELGATTLDEIEALFTQEGER
jgi:transcriptional regulator with XRE-family HTH domain